MEPFELSWKRVYWQLRQLAFQRCPGEPLGLTLHKAAAEYRVNIKTVSRAVRQLKAEGILLVKRKSGTFVHPQRPSFPKDGKILLHVVRFYESRMSIGLLDEISKSIDDLAEINSYRVITIDPFKIRMVSDLLKEGKMFGALLNTFMGVEGMAEAAESLRSFGLRLCSIDDSLPGIDSVIYDNSDIGRQIGKMVISKTNDNYILGLRQGNYTKSRFDREDGFQRVCNSSPKTASKLLWLSMMPEPIPGLQMVESYLKNGVRFDAAFVHSPNIAQSLKALCKTLKVPPPFIAAFGNRTQLENTRTAGAYLDTQQIVRDAINQLFDQARDSSRSPVVIKHKALTYIPV